MSPEIRARRQVGIPLEGEAICPACDGNGINAKLRACEECHATGVVPAVPELVIVELLRSSIGADPFRGRAADVMEELYDALKSVREALSGSLEQQGLAGAVDLALARARNDA